jgi:hypothetical protein
MRKRRLITTVTLLATGVAVSSAMADGGSGTHSGPASGTSRAEMSSSTYLQAMPHGSAAFRRGMGGDLVVRLRLFGLTPNSAHGVDVEGGQCPTMFRLGTTVGDVQADANGDVDQTLDLAQPMEPHSPVALTIREGVPHKIMDGGVNPLAAEGLACVEIPGHVMHHARARRLRSGSESGMSLRGRVTVSSNGTSATVTVHASGFVPHSVHAAHIHQGSCGMQGPVVGMLGDLTADGHGRISATRTVTLMASPPTNQQPTLMFRPLLCANISLPSYPQVYVNIHQGDGDHILTPLASAQQPVASTPSPPVVPPSPPVVSGKHW